MTTDIEKFPTGNTGAEDVKTIQYIELWGSGCGLSTDTKQQILQREGTANVKLVRPATQHDVDWVRAMGGYVPDGRIAELQEPKT